MSKYCVSVIVPTFNPEWDDLIATLNSIVSQEDISYEIIIADDASLIDMSERIHDFFSQKHFENYKVLRHRKNTGTVINILDAVESCEGEYIRDIGQGDVLFNKTTLSDLYNFAKMHNSDCVLSEVVSFVKDGNHLYVEPSFAMPQNPKAFINKKTLKREYLIYSDVGNGATSFYKKSVYLKYLKEGASVIKYSEDQLIKLMVLDGCEIDYYSRITLFYEYTAGVSHSGLTLLQKDAIALSELIYKRLNDTKEDRCIKKITERRINFFRNSNLANNVCWLFSDPGLCFYRIKTHLIPRKTIRDANLVFLKECFPKH